MPKPSKSRKTRKLATPYGRPFPEGPRAGRPGRNSRVAPVAPLSQGERPLASAPAVPPMAGTLVSKKFEEVWDKLFMTPVHLDSLLSKQPKNVKTILARILPSILLRPVSHAESLGIGVAPDEPWSLQPAKLAHWRPASLLAQRMYQMMSQRNEAPAPQPGDFPAAMIQDWEKNWGRAKMLELVETLGTEPPLGLRASRKAGAKKVLEALTAGSKLPVKAQLSNFSPLGVRLAGYAPVLGTELYEQGAFEIQDEGSQLMALFALWPSVFAPVLQKQPGKVQEKGFRLELPAETQPWTVVDACAGAGGKSLAMSDALKGKGRVFAYDTSATKLQSLRRRATHAGLNNIQAVVVQDGEEAKTVEKFKRRAHVVLVDAPCSGWGVLRRNPDIKWRQENETLERMPKIQLRLLSEYSRLVAGEGRLTYGVCTFRKEETVDVVEAFLAAHPEFEAREGGYLGPGPCDGFFMRSFVRRKAK